MAPPPVAASANAGSRLDTVMSDPQVEAEGGQAPEASADPWASIVGDLNASAKAGRR